MGKSMDSYEPSADSRQLAKSIYDIYAGMVKAGFTEEQGMEVVNNMFQTVVLHGLISSNDDES
jgi:hypothetical protein